MNEQLRYELDRLGSIIRHVQWRVNPPLVRTGQGDYARNYTPKLKGQPDDTPEQRTTRN